MTSSYQFRHIGLTPQDTSHMLDVVGYANMDALIDAAVPSRLRLKREIGLEPSVDEEEIHRELRELASLNHRLVPMLGQGYTRCITPAVIRRNVLENPGWYTAYTPYQPEISQGRLEALLVFQTMVADLTGLATANASMLDEATAVAEAITVARRSYRGTSSVVAIDADLHPHVEAVVRTRCEPIGIEVVPFAPDVDSVPECFAAVVAYPSSLGRLMPLDQVAEHVHARGGFLIAAADLMALTVVESPGSQGADVCVGSAQRFGVPLGFGGPHAGFMAVRTGLERALPGRLVGVSKDRHGSLAYRLALQTREQHIRREKATSNICTAQVLLAVISGFYGAYHGPAGLTEIANRIHQRATEVAVHLESQGVRLVHETFFDTVTAELPGLAAAVGRAAAERGVEVRVVDVDRFSVTCDETTRARHLQVVCDAVAEVAGTVDRVPEVPPQMRIPEQLQRTTSFMTHPWFHQYRSETSMMRWLRRLADADLALDRSMIPLGSCTMKLNAAAAMEPISWPDFADIHPFTSREHTRGYLELCDRLERWLCAITGYDAFSLQPNAGSQGEFAGLLAIRGYLRDQGQAQRDVCLIPASAHGTNAASAVMAGMRVVVVACDDTGGVDVEDLYAKIDAHRDELAAIMVTYPSTYGVYEDTVTEVCEAVHAAGGQVYVDGANLNALVGVAGPGDFGADVSHLNLHKTFCIPHGGGGPGVGPVGVRAHLAPYLPRDIQVAASEDTDSQTATRRPVISGSPFGSAGILPIPYAYIRMMGEDGLRAATAAAVLAANYVAVRLQKHYPILFRGQNNLVAHECILDLRPLTAESGVTVDDVAKRLIDYGFHAPTMSFPIAGTLMVEPTESESLVELDRFCEAMIAIHGEIAAVTRGDVAVNDSVLRNAPHTAAELAGDWSHEYSRQLAAYPTQDYPTGKYFPPVARIDGAFGDRNLQCSCPPIEDWA